MPTLEERARTLAGMMDTPMERAIRRSLAELVAAHAEGMEEAARIAYSNAIANEDVDNCCCADAIRSAIQRERAVIEEKT